jgi:hypothetical protein
VESYKAGSQRALLVRNRDLLNRAKPKRYIDKRVYASVVYSGVIGAHSSFKTLPPLWKLVS